MISNSNYLPSNQRKLYGFQEILANLVNLYKKNNLPNKILFSGPKGIGKATLSYHLVNFILSNDEKYKYDLNKSEINDLNKSYNLIKNKSHPNFLLVDVIDGKNKIEISQIRELISYSNKSSFNNKERIIFIDNIENLNFNSLNALLKIIEEPNDNVIFILVLNNYKNISATLKSRCIKFNLSLSFDERIKITNKLINNDITNILNKDLIHYYNTPGDYLNLINFSKNSKINLLDYDLKKFLFFLIESNDFKKNSYVQNNIFKFIELYFLKLMKISTSKKEINILNSFFVKKISDLKKFNLDPESLFIEFKTRILGE